MHYFCDTGKLKFTNIIFVSTSLKNVSKPELSIDNIFVVDVSQTS